MYRETCKKKTPIYRSDELNFGLSVMNVEKKNKISIEIAFSMFIQMS